MRLPAFCSAIRRAAAWCRPRPPHYLIDYFAAYAQDEYRVTSALTVNYGLRYEHEPGVRERDNHLTVGFDREAAFPVQVPGSI